MPPPSCRALADLPRRLNPPAVSLMMPPGGSADSSVVHMADVTLRNIDPLLMERIRRLSVARGWTREETCLALLEQGLFTSEQHVRGGFESPEVDVLSEAIKALQALPTGSDI